ncbi:MAG: asparagine--tRNA ligase [Anaerohalosphaeraceae bacterium]|nr:asparagine--tRNA ligase [Anaerohalosphaeraceae bacterium]
MPDNLTRICNLKDNVGKIVTLGGWVYHCRPGGKVIFLVLRDGSGLCQCVIEKANITEELFDQLKHLSTESSLTVTGTAKKDARSTGGYELAVTDAKILCPSKDYPITPKSHGTDFLLKNRHLHLRSQKTWCIGRIRHTLIDAIRTFFNSNGFTLVDTPILTGIAGEEAGSLFEVDYFGQPAHLTQTGQLHLESATMSFGKVYCFGPTFRAEKSKTRRHLTEFWMVEPEVAFIDLDGLLELSENFVASLVTAVLKNNRAELQTLGADIEALKKITAPFYRLTYTEAVDILTSKKTVDFFATQLEDFKTQKQSLLKKIDSLQGESETANKQWKKDKLAAELIDARAELGEIEIKIENNPKHAELAVNFQWGKDLGGSNETIISMMHDKPVFVTHYPAAAKAFYMKQNLDNADIVNNFDMLAPAGFGEIIGGSMREDDYEKLLNKINAQEYDLENYQWYLDLRRYGSVPHGGFGLGVERTLAWLTGEKHIRQCIAFPRMTDKIMI